MGIKDAYTLLSSELSMGLIGKFQHLFDKIQSSKIFPSPLLCIVSELSPKIATKILKAKSVCRVLHEHYVGHMFITGFHAFSVNQEKSSYSD